MAESDGSRPDLAGRFACRLCLHDQYLHNRLQGCPFCTCLATPGEAGAVNDRQADLAILPPDRTVGHYRLRTEPVVPPLPTEQRTQSFIFQRLPQPGEPVQIPKALDVTEAPDFVEDLRQFHASDGDVIRVLRKIVTTTYEIVEEPTDG